LAQPHTQKQVAATSKAETVVAHQKAELEKKVAANLKAERQQADGATAKGAIATATAENDTMATARQKAENTEYIAQLTAELTANAETMEDEEEGLISDQGSMSTSSVDTECTTSASEPDESDNDFTTVNRDRKRKRTCQHKQQWLGRDCTGA